MDYKEKSIEAHKKARGKIEIKLKMPLESKEDLSIAYTPGVAGPALEIHKNPKSAYDLTAMKNSVAVISDGSSVLGLGDAGPEAALPVLEGKAMLFKKFASVDAFPIAVSVREVDDIVRVIESIALTFGGINLEDISAPRCFEIEKRLIQKLPIPVFHDDQHGTAIVVLAGLLNSLKIVSKKKEEIRVVINGAGAAGIAISKLLYRWGARSLVILDSKGIISSDRTDLPVYKQDLLSWTNTEKKKGYLKEALAGADVCIGVSRGNIVTADVVRRMNKDSIVFALANPDPEIMPDEAKKGGARIIATGRSDFPNQINNALVFPGVFKGALDARISQITDEMKIKAAEALAGLVKNPSEEKIIPSIFDDGVADAVARAVMESGQYE